MFSLWWKTKLHVLIFEAPYIVLRVLSASAPQYMH